MSALRALSQADLQRVAATAEHAPHRVRVIDSSIGKVVVKAQRPKRGVWLYALMNLLAKTVGMSALLAAPAHGGSKAQSIEVQRLESLRSAGLNVPLVLARLKNCIALEHLGEQNLLDAVRRGGDGAMLAWLQGLDCIAQVHARNQYLSQAFARNFMLHKGKLWLIDFEDDPLEVMSLEQAQTRDWLAYLHSTVWILGAGACLAPLHEQLSRLSPSARKNFDQAAKRLAWLRHLPTRRKPWGRDVISAQALGDLLWQLQLFPIRRDNT